MRVVGADDVVKVKLLLSASSSHLLLFPDVNKELAENSLSFLQYSSADMKTSLQRCPNTKVSYYENVCQECFLFSAMWTLTASTQLERTFKTRAMLQQSINREVLFSSYGDEPPQCHNVTSMCREKKIRFPKSVSHHQHQACTHRSRRAERQIVISFRYAGTTEGMLCYPNSTGHKGQSYIILTGVEQRPGIINSVYKELSRRDKTVIRIPNRVLVQLNCLQNLDLNSYENVQSLMSE